VEIENPIWRQATRDHYFKRARTMGQSERPVAPLNWLTFDAQLSYDKSTRNTRSTCEGRAPRLLGEQPAEGDLYFEHQENDHTAPWASTFAAFGELNAAPDRAAPSRRSGRVLRRQRDAVPVTGVRT